MGQQQLLLLVLGMAVVCVAVVAGTQAFSEGKSKSERDAAASDAMRIVSSLQAWKLKPEALGGGAKKIGAPKFQDLGYPASAIFDGEYRAASGCYSLSDLPNGIARLTVYLRDAKTGECLADMYATIDVRDTKAEDTDIVWAYAT